MQAILRQIINPQNLRQLPVCQPPHIIHLPQPILRHSISQRSKTIRHRSRFDMRHTPPIAQHRHRLIDRCFDCLLRIGQFLAQKSPLKIPKRSVRNTQFTGCLLNSYFAAQRLHQTSFSICHSPPNTSISPFAIRIGIWIVPREQPLLQIRANTCKISIVNQIDTLARIIFQIV